MDRSQEKGMSSQGKLQTLDQSKNIHQKVHENQAGITIGVNRVPQRKISNESSNDSLSYVDARNGIEGVNTRKIEPLVPSYLHASNPGMSLPYLPTHSMDPRALRNLFYSYGPQMVGFSGYTGVYGQRLANGEDMRENRSSTSTPADRPESVRDSKEPIRTESVIKIATDRTDSSKQDDKRESRPSNDEHSRHYPGRNGDDESFRNMNPYRGSRDKLDGALATSNGDIRNTTPKQIAETSSSERTIGAFSSYPSQSVYSKCVSPASRQSDYVYSNQKAEFSKTVTTSSNLFASMPKLTPIAPRGFSSSGFPPSSTASEATERQSVSSSVWRPQSIGYFSRDHPLCSTSEALVSLRSSAGENSNRSEENSEAKRVSYSTHSLYENNCHSQESLAVRERNFPYSWERNTAEISSHYPGHSAYQGYAYGRTFQTKCPSDRESIKETEEVRNRTSDSTKESAVSVDRLSIPRYPKDNVKAQITEVNKTTKEQPSQNHKVAATSQQDGSFRAQANLNKNEKPIVAENARYKVKDDRKKCVLKSDKVTVYPRQGMAYVVSVQKTPQKVSDYFSNGRLPSADVTTVSSESTDRAQLPVGYEAASKDEGQRHGNIREGSNKLLDKGPDNSIPQGTTVGEYLRRNIEASSTNKNVSVNVEDTKKNNDKNNNSSFGAYQYPGFPSQSERLRTPNRITLSQDKVFVPPNATLEMFEKRELEMERAAASCRSADGSRVAQFGSNFRQKQSGRKEHDIDSRSHSPEQPSPRLTNHKQDNKINRGETNSKGSDDDDLKIIEGKPDGQPRSLRTEDKRSSSSPRHSRITSPVAATSSTSNPPYLTPFGVNFPARRTPTDGDAAARENAERSLQAAAYMYGTNLPYQANSPYLGSNVRADMQVMLPVDPAMFYSSSLYKQSMMDPSQGGTVMQDPLTGSLVVVPEALMSPNMFGPLADSQLMFDPARFWSMQQSMEDPRLQQFYQQQKQFYEHQLEKYKHEMMVAQQQGRWPGYSLYPFYQKPVEAQKKEENERNLRNVEHRPKAREEQPSQPRVEKSEDPATKEQNPNSSEEKHFIDSRREELESRWDSSKRPQDLRGESRSVSFPEKKEKEAALESKHPGNEHSESRDKVKENIQQDEQDRQFQQYMLREPVFNPSKFPFTRIPTSLSTSHSNPKSPVDVSRDRVRDLRENSRGESTQSPQAPLSEMSPQVVSAAATLANMDFGTRFPFNQQSSTQLDNQNALRGAEQIDSGNKRAVSNKTIPREEKLVRQPIANGQSPTDNRISLAVGNKCVKSYSPTKPINVGTPQTNTIRGRREQSIEISASERKNIDVQKGLLNNESIPTKAKSTSSQNSVKMEYHRNGEEECTRLLVAKAEKLPQDEELEVIRIDTPYACGSDSEQTNISAEKRQEMDLLMLLSKGSNDPLESPSSKSEIVWVECSEEEEEDFEVRTINSSAKIKSEFDGHDKENDFKLSLQNAKSESEKKCIREKIEKLREVAKRRTREERFTALTRQKELRSPASIVNSVTSSLNEVLDMNVMEKDLRMRLADLQKKYREKHRELTRLQPKAKDGNDDGGKITPVKRGPGRPRKRKYFGASSRSGKTTPTTPNGSVDFAIKSGGSSPSSSPQSPEVKSITSEENPTVKEEPVKKKKKGSTDKVEERVPTLPSSPRIASPTEMEVKPPRVKSSKKASISVDKTKVNMSTIITPTTSSSNMAKLIDAISPSMLNDTSNMETENQPSTTDFQTLPSKTKSKKTKKVTKREKKASTEDNVDNKEKRSSESLKVCGSPTPVKIKKVRNPKIAKKKVKQPPTPKTNSEFIFPVTSGKVLEQSTIKKKDFAKPVGSQSVEKKVDQESNGDSSENDEVFTACHGGGALDMLANFASSASFEKEKQSERESPFEDIGKASKRGRPKKPNSPGPESVLDTTPTTKKKKKKRKPSNSSPKSSKKSNIASEEKENDFINSEVGQQSPTQIHQEKTELKEQSKTEVLEEQVEKVPELREETEEEQTEFVADSESVTPSDHFKEKRRKSRSNSVKELDENKSNFVLFSDWQPRRSERIFINSSVAPPPNADSSPLSSPTAKPSDFGWPKKVKRFTKVKKLSKTDSVSDAEPAEDETQPPSTKALIKQKKKKSPAKGKKRRSSSTTDPDFVLRIPKRKAAKRDRSYEEADEEDEEEDEEEEEEYHDEMGEVSEQVSKEDQEEHIEEESQADKPNQPEKESSGTTDLEMMEESVTNTTAEEKYKSNKIINNNISADKKESVSEEEPVKKVITENGTTDLEKNKENLQREAEKKDFPVWKDKGENSNEGSEAMGKDTVETTEQKKETLSKKGEDKQGGQIKTDGNNSGTEESTTEVFNADHSSSDELDSISHSKRKLPPEPVISFTKDELKENAKMLLPVDRVFYRGRIAFYQDPDLYGIVLPGERGRRPHLRSTEQLLSQAVKDVVPSAVEYLPVGTRVCAHWSPQYRCFYPGSVIETPPDEKCEVGKLWVEFDDGDSGIFPLSDLRKIKTQYPVQVEDVESDVVVPGRRPRSASRATSPTSTRRSRDPETSIKNKDDDTSGWESSEETIVKRPKGRAKRRVRLRTRDRRLSGEATDSDVPRGSRDSDFEESIETTKRDNRINKIDNKDKDYEAEIKSISQTRGPKRERRKAKSRDELPKIYQDKTKDNIINFETFENTKKDLKNEKCGFGSKERHKFKPTPILQKQQDDDSDVCDDNEAPQETGTGRSRCRSSRLSELDLRKKSLTLNLNTSASRSTNTQRESSLQDSTSQDEDSESCSEVCDESPQMENKGFQPRLGKRRRSQLDRLRQDKSQGEPWQWSGKNFQNKRKGKGRKVFYKTIVRDDETISVGDCAVFTSNPSKSNNLPYVGMIENMWEGCSGNMVVKVKWFYHPEETKAGRRASDAKNSLYRSTHVDENDVQTISHKCEVVSPDELKRRIQSQETIGTRSSTNDRSERLFCCVGTYDPSTEKIETS